MVGCPRQRLFFPIADIQGVHQSGVRPQSGSSQIPIYPAVSYRNLIVYELPKGLLKNILNDPPCLSIGLTSTEIPIF